MFAFTVHLIIAHIELSNFIKYLYLTSTVQTFWKCPSRNSSPTLLLIIMRKILLSSDLNIESFHTWSHINFLIRKSQAQIPYVFIDTIEYEWYEAYILTVLDYDWKKARMSVLNSDYYFQRKLVQVFTMVFPYFNHSLIY